MQVVMERLDMPGKVRNAVTLLWASLLLGFVEIVASEAGPRLIEDYSGELWVILAIVFGANDFYPYDVAAKELGKNRAARDYRAERRRTCVLAARNRRRSLVVDRAPVCQHGRRRDRDGLALLEHGNRWFKEGQSV